MLSVNLPTFRPEMKQLLIDGARPIRYATRQPVLAADETAIGYYPFFRTGVASAQPLQARPTHARKSEPLFLESLHQYAHSIALKPRCAKPITRIESECLRADPCQTNSHRLIGSGENQMDPANFTANLSMVRDHLPLFLCLLFGLPIVGFIGILYWVAAHAAKVQRNTHWFVPTDLESDAAKMHYSMEHDSAAFAHHLHRRERHSRPKPRN